MRTPAEIDMEMNKITEFIRPYQIRLNDLRMEKRKVESLNWIYENGVTRSNVEFSSGNDRPYFGHIMQFSEWLIKTGCTKPFCEWNTMIYRTDEIKNGRMCNDPKACIDDLEY